MRTYLLIIFVTIAWLTAPPARADEERAIRAEVTVAAAIKDVWSAWTTRDGLRGFFAPEAVVEPRVGGLFELHMNPLAPAGEKGADGMRFLALQEPHMLTFTWNAPPHLALVRAQRTVVIIRLQPESETMTKVSLVHIGWGKGGEWDKAHGYFTKAWPNVLNNLRDRYVKGPYDWGPWLKQLEAMQKAK
jgi:uncharacterized protein YndB with AHSA1/START domain